ncbi:hypothetical protein [Haliangium sp.]|uniref:hypothetical protein n=1 Tax=Haliangium sp. TaxID=2663208 RepID=UPI003D12576E
MKTRSQIVSAAGLVSLVMGAAALIVLVAGMGTAQAQDASQASCSFLEITATSGEGGIDPALAPLATKLGKPPFSAWKSFKLVARHDQTLTRMKVQDIKLSAGGKLGVLFRQHTRAQGKKDRLSLSLTLDDKGGKRALDTKVHVDAGDYFVIVIGQSADKGHLLAFTCTAK